jgi:hypothetical protein
VSIVGAQDNSKAESNKVVRLVCGVQAVKLAIRRIETDSTPNDEQYILPGTPGMSPAELQEALRGIQAAIFAAWDPPSF